MKEKLISYWQNLQVREQRMLISGGGVLVLLFLYLWIDSGFVRVHQMQQQLNNEQKLLAFMQPNVAEILMAKTQHTGERVTVQNILPQVEFSLAEAGLSGQVSALNLVAENQVRIEFDFVVYEALVDWLYAFSRQGVIIREFTATKTDKIGEVQAGVLLSAQ